MSRPLLDKKILHPLTCTCRHGKAWHDQPCPCGTKHDRLLPLGACSFHYGNPGEQRCYCREFVSEAACTGEEEG